MKKPTGSSPPLVSVIERVTPLDPTVASPNSAGSGEAMMIGRAPVPLSSASKAGPPFITARTWAL